VEQRFGQNLVGDRYYQIRTYWIEDDGEWHEQYEGKDWRRRSKFGRSYEDRDEFRITGGLPRDYFRYIQPGSLIALARERESQSGKEYSYYCLTIESGSSTYDEFIRTLVIPDPPWSGVVDIRSTFFRRESAVVVSDVGSVADLEQKVELLKTLRPIATVEELVKETIRRYENRIEMPLTKLFSITPKPGDIVRELMEKGFEILKRQQQEIYPIKIAELIWSATDNGSALTRESLALSIALKMGEIRSVFKSMQNSIFSLAGSCFEKYIEKWLGAFDLPFNSQEKVDGDRVPDFILPNSAYYMARESRSSDDAVLLSAKTTCRERWTQILSEGTYVDTRYLATLDAAVPRDKIVNMHSERVVMIVPESQKKALEHYRAANNVLEFHDFMSKVLLVKRSLWV
jgi:hypothetical protein